jgi:hypothetical protein
MPLNNGEASYGGLATAATGTVAVFWGGFRALELWFVSSRLEKNADAVFAVLQTHADWTDSVEQFHRETIASSHPETKWPSKAHAEHLGSLARALDDELANARRCEALSCGVFKHLGTAGICRDALNAIALLTTKGRRVKDLAAFADAQAASLAGQDVRRRFVLPSTRAATRSSFFGESSGHPEEDAGAVVQLAREQAGPRSVSPLGDFQRELQSVVADGETVAARLAPNSTAAFEHANFQADSTRSQSLLNFQADLERHAGALRLLNSQPELFAERERAKQQAVAERSAAAAERSAGEAAAMRLAEEQHRNAAMQRAAAARSCRDAIQDLTAALRALPQGALTEVRPRQRLGARGLPTPGQITECRNWEDESEPITLEPIRSCRPADLVILPCGKCMLSENVHRLRHPSDPFTNQPLPPPVTAPSALYNNNSAPAAGGPTSERHGLDHDHGRAVRRLISRAEVACRG